MTLAGFEKLNGTKESMWAKLNRCYLVQLELVPLGLLLLACYLVFTAYPLLPANIPTHFNIAGVSDDWGDKSEIFIYPGLSALFYLMFTGINIWLAIANDPRQLINLPRARKATLTNAQVEQLRVFLNRALFLLKTLMQGLNTYSAYITIEVALGRASTLGAPWFLFLLGILAVAGHMVWQSFSLTRPRRQVQSK